MAAGNYHCGILSGHQDGSAGQGMLNEGRGPDKWKQRLAGEMDYRGFGQIDTNGGNSR